MFSIVAKNIIWSASFTSSSQRLLADLGKRFSQSKRVRDLQEVKITLPTQSSEVVAEPERVDYVAMRQQIRQLNWQNLQFDKLCGLSESTVSLINMQIKKDKFNVDDSEFYAYSLQELHIKLQNNVSIIEKLNPYYRRMYYLLMNQLPQYDQITKVTSKPNYYRNEMYVMDLEKNNTLKNVIEYFVNNINHPKKLEIVAEPSFIKYLLAAKRELMLQGIHFQNQKDEKLKKKYKLSKLKQKVLKEDEDEESLENMQQESIGEGQQAIDNDAELQDSLLEERHSRIDSYIKESLKESKLNVKILRVLGYEYEFWVDVKHNRGKNGVEQDYIIEERQIDNPNDSILIKEKYPKIKVRYIVHKRKRKDYSMHFCIKSNLLIDVAGSYKKVKIEWRGPSNNTKQNLQETSFVIIDYENLMNGNPTIKPVFFF